MSNYNINENPDLLKSIIEKYKASEEQMKRNPDSVLLNFKQELLDLGFEFQVLNQAEVLLPKYKETVLPIVIKYYKKAKLKNEKRYLLGWFHHRGLEEAVPMLLEDFYSNNADRWAIGDRLYQIRSRQYVDDYLNIISDSSYKEDRQMVVLLIGKLKVESAVPVLIDLLEDTSVRLHAVIALGNFKKEAFRKYFERFENSTNSALRKAAKTALKKLDS